MTDDGTPSRTIGVAVPVPEPFASELRRWRESFGDPLAASVPTHVTLLPPTVVATEALPAIERHLADVAGTETPFWMRLRGAASFRPVSAVVFVTLAAGGGACARMERKVRCGPLARAVDFPYHPHVTVAHDVDDAALDRALKELAHYEACFRVAGFALYEHGADGVWRTRRVFRLGGIPS